MDGLRWRWERVGAPFMPVPFASSLEKGYAVGVDAVLAAARKTLN